MSHKSVVHSPVVNNKAGRHNSGFRSSVGIMGATTKKTVVVQSGWSHFVDSLPVFGTTEEEKVDTGSRLNPFTRLGAYVSLPVFGAILNALATTKYDKSIDFLKHYTYGRGAAYQLEVPLTWQQAITARYKKPGHYREVSPYNWGMKDIQNSLGHFDLKVVKNSNQTLAYFITDEYKFPAPKNQRQRHGFQVPGLTDDRAAYIRTHLLPADVYTNRNGFKEKWELVKIQHEWTLFIPQPFLDDYGVNFKVSGNFTVPAK